MAPVQTRMLETGKSSELVYSIEIIIIIIIILYLKQSGSRNRVTDPRLVW